MLSRLLAGPTAIVYWGGSLWGFFLTMDWLIDQIGWVFAILSLFLLPIVHYLAPLAAGLMDGYWLPLAVSWGTTGLVLVMSFAIAATGR